MLKEYMVIPYARILRQEGGLDIFQSRVWNASDEDERWIIDDEELTHDQSVSDS